MYISIKLPPAFGSFGKIQRDNYPFNSLFTSYLATVSRLGMALSMDVGDLVGYIEDQVFGEGRLPDVPEGGDAVNIRYRTEDPDIKAYIAASSLTNRMAVLYIVRMTMRLSAAYGTSLLRLTRIIEGLSGAQEKQPVCRPPKAGPRGRAAGRAPVQAELVPDMQDAGMGRDTGASTGSPAAPRVSIRPAVPPMGTEKVPSTGAARNAEAARAALSELQELTSRAGDVVETNPLLSEFM